MMLLSSRSAVAASYATFTGCFRGRFHTGERLELGVAGVDATLMLVVQLRETHGELAGAGAGSRDDHEGLRGLDVLVLAEAVAGHYEVHVRGVARDGVVAVHRDAHLLKACLVGLGLRLPREARDHHAADGEAHAAEHVHQAQDVVAVADADVAAALALLDVVRVQGEHDLRIVCQLPEHARLRVWLEAREDAARVVVVEQLATELQVELASELRDALADARRLRVDVLLVVKARLHGCVLRLGVRLVRRV
jgi:hypothetical protein